jgi:geranylgeranyl diphosphate synthase, type II
VSEALRTARLEFLDVERRRIDEALGRVCAELVECGPAAIAAPIRHSLRAGGKRLRPILCIEAFRAVRRRDGDAALYELAAGLELLHTYSLMHDDLPCMDDDELRRGAPTAHRVFGVAAATVAGAALIALAVRCIDDAGRRLGLASERRRASIAELVHGAGAGGMVGGQLLDLQAEGRRLGRGELEAVHERKTGALFAAAARIGATAAGGSEAQIAALGRFGSALGLAFQIADDVLDEVGRTDQLGKTAGRDRALEKATFAALLGVASARATARAAAATAIGALRAADVNSPRLAELARFAAERDR